MIETVASIDDTDYAIESASSTKRVGIRSSLESVKSAALRTYERGVFCNRLHVCLCLCTCLVMERTAIWQILGKLTFSNKLEGAKWTVPHLTHIGASNSLKIESTAHVVLPYAKLNDSEIILLFDAEVSFYNSETSSGGYGSTQDAVVALESLIDVREAHERSEQLWVTSLLSFSNEVGARCFTVDAMNFDTFNTVQIAQRGGGIV